MWVGETNKERGGGREGKEKGESGYMSFVSSKFDTSLMFSKHNILSNNPLHCKLIYVHAVYVSNLYQKEASAILTIGVMYSLLHFKR